LNSRDAGPVNCIFSFGKNNLEWPLCSFYPASASVDLIMGAQGQQEDGLLAFVLRVLEDDTQIVSPAASPTTCQATAQLVCSQRRMRCVSRQLLERRLDGRRRVGVCLQPPPQVAPERRRA
jgi:hypothetical protein